MGWSVTQQALNKIEGVGGILRVNGSVVYDPMMISDGSFVEIVLTGYTFTKAPTLSGRHPATGGMVYEDMVLTSPERATIVIDGDFEDIEIHATAAVSKAFTYDESIHRDVVNSGGVLYRNGEPMEVGDDAVEGDTISIVLGEGYSFVGDVNLKRREPNTGAYETLPFDVEGNVASVVLVGGIWDILELNTELVTPEVSGSNNVYVIDSDKLAGINKKRIVTNTGGAGGIIDYGQFILGLIEVPFTIPQDVVVGVESVRLGSLDTGVEATKLGVDKLRIDLGTIKVDRVSNSLLDYSNSTAILHLPRVPSVVIDLNKVVGGVLSIEYVLDCYVGDVDVIISSSLTGGVIHTMKSTIGVNVPYAHVGDVAMVSNDNVRVGGENNITTPYVEIVQYDNLLVDGMFTIPVPVDGLLEVGAGYVEVEKIKLDINATRDEIDMLESVLTGGIYL